MFGLVRTAVRFFFIGMGVGVLLAPRSGAETRAIIREKIDGLLKDVIEVATVTDTTPRASSSAAGQTRPSRERREAGTGAAAPR